METYNQIKKDIGFLIVFVFIFTVITNSLDFGVDDTDKNGWNRSGVTLITDYGTGVQYLYRDGAIIRRKSN